MSKITIEELQKLQNLRLRYQQTIFEIGEKSIAYIQLEKQIKEIEILKEHLFKDFDIILSEQEVLHKTIYEKYGEGVIDPETGEISSNQ